MSDRVKGGARITIYVPPDLKAEMRASATNWSRVAQDAFRARLKLEKRVEVLMKRGK